MNIKDLIKLTGKYNHHLIMISGRERDLKNWVKWDQNCKSVLDAKKSIEIYKRLNKELEVEFKELDVDFSCSQ